MSWPEADQDKAIAWQEHQASKCPRCGTFPEDWLDSMGVQILPPPMEAASMRCYGCVELEAAQVQAGDNKGVYFYLKPWTGEGEFVDGP